MTCGGCETPTAQGIHLCPGCRDKLLDDLREVPSMVEALWASAARMDVGAGSVGSSGHSAPMEPTNSRAYDAGRTLNVILTGWSGALGNRQPDAGRAARVLLAQIREVRGHDWAPVLAEELHGALNDCRAAMDRTAPRISLGKCTDSENGEYCYGEVIAIVGETHGRCRTCGTPRDVKAHQEHMIAGAWHVQAPLPQILRALKSSGHLNIPPKRVEHWVQRGKLLPVAESLFTPAAVMAAFHETPTGRKKLAQVA